MLEPASVVRSTQATGVGDYIASVYGAYLWGCIPVPKFSRAWIARLSPTCVVGSAVSTATSRTTGATSTALDDALVGRRLSWLDWRTRVARLEHPLVVRLTVTAPTQGSIATIDRARIVHAVHGSIHRCDRWFRVWLNRNAERSFLLRDGDVLCRGFRDGKVDHNPVSQGHLVVTVDAVGQHRDGVDLALVSADIAAV